MSSSESRVNASPSAANPTSGVAADEDAPTTLNQPASQAADRTLLAPTPGRAARVPKRARALPDASRGKLVKIAEFMRRLYADSGLSQETITQQARRYYPGLSKGTIARLALPTHMVSQSDVGYLLLDAVLLALGSSHLELDAYVRLARPIDTIVADRRRPPGTPVRRSREDWPTEAAAQAAYEQEREQEMAAALVRLWRGLSPLGRQYLFEDAQTYTRREAAAFGASGSTTGPGAALTASLTSSEPLGRGGAPGAATDAAVDAAERQAQLLDLLETLDAHTQEQQEQLQDDPRVANGG